MIAVKDMEMPSCCEVCDFRKSDLYSGEVYCSKAAGDNIILHEDEKLDNCPLVEIEERRVGKWIRKPIRNEQGGCVGAKMICSRCNKDNRHDEYMDYCPHCSAEMRGVENG